MFTRSISALLILLFFSVFSSPIEAIEIPLERSGGVFTLPVKINGVITLKFILDSGASEVVIPADVALTLIRTGTIRESDFLSGGHYRLADGSELKSARLVLRELEFGGIRVNNVACSVSPAAGDLLLGQSLLGKLDSWTLDNKRHVLIVGSAAAVLPSQRSEPRTAGIARQEALQFLIDYFSFTRVGNLERVLSCYAEQVDYFSKGFVGKDFIRKDKEAYFRFFPTINYYLDGDVAFRFLDSTGQAELRFTYTFLTENSKQTITGKADNTWKIDKINNQLKIVGEQQNVTSRDVKMKDK